MGSRFAWFLAGFVAALVFFCSCGHVTSDGHARVAVYGCDVIVDDTLGRMPPSHGGPVARAEYGTGIECVVWGF